MPQPGILRGAQCEQEERFAIRRTQAGKPPQCYLHSPKWLAEQIQFKKPRGEKGPLSSQNFYVPSLFSSVS